MVVWDCFIGEERIRNDGLINILKMKNRSRVLLLVVFNFSQINAQEIKVFQLKRDIYYLADDKLEGRETGEKGCELAAEYISKRYKQIGLLPKGDGTTYLKKYEVKIPANPHAAKDSTAKVVQSANIIGFINNKAENTNAM